MAMPDLASLTVPKLKEICKSLGLTVGGKKVDLVARIEAKQGVIGTGTITTIVPIEEEEFPLDPQLANATNRFEKIVAGDVSGTAPVQNSNTAATTVSKKRRAGDSGVVKSRKSGAIERKSRGKVEKRGKSGKEALGRPIGTLPESPAQILSGTVRNVSVTAGNDANMEVSFTTVLVLPSTTDVNVTGNSSMKRVVSCPHQPPAPEPQVQQVSSAESQYPAGAATVPEMQNLVPGKLFTDNKLSTSSIGPHGSRMGTVKTEDSKSKAKKNNTSNNRRVIAPVIKTAPILLPVGKASHPPWSPVDLDMAGDSRVINREFSTSGIVDEGSEQVVQKVNTIAPKTLSITCLTARTTTVVDRDLDNFNTIYSSNLQPRFDEREKNSFAVSRKKLALTMKPVRGKLLEPVGVSASTGIELGTNAEAPLPTSRQDIDINWKLIRFPPSYGFRRMVESISRVLALVARHSSTSMSPAGYFLLYTATLSKVWYYSSILAYYHLSIFEFEGRRTSQWIKVKRTDTTRADFRGWYWYRVQQREIKMQMVKRGWWGERIFREYILANWLQREHGSSEKDGLWCSAAISMELVSENETIGQWDIAARFWARRFCAAMFSGKIEEGGRNMQIILGCGNHAVVDVCPVGENGGDGHVSAGGAVSELWQVITKGAGAYIVVGGTGEVIGSLQGAESDRRRGLRCNEHRTGTPMSTGEASRLRQFTKMRGNNTLHKLTDQWDVSWNSLRLDWRAYASKLVAYATQPVPPGLRGASMLRGSTIAAHLGTPIIEPVPLLLSHIYHPSPKQFEYAIHRNITLPHHRVIAERFILAHAEEYGFSGGMGNPISGGKKVGIDVDSKWRVESVVCSGEEMKVTGGRVGRLENGVAFVQTAEGGWYILEDTGEILAQEEYGISGVWATILGVDEKGFDVGRRGFLEIRGLFRER